MTKEKKSSHQKSNKKKMPVTHSFKKALAENTGKGDTSSICTMLEALTGIKFNATKWYNYTAIDHDHVPRADLIPAICATLGTLEPLKAIVEHIPGVCLISETDALRLEKLKIDEEIKRQEERKAVLDRKILALENGGNGNGKK